MVSDDPESFVDLDGHVVRPTSLDDPISDWNAGIEALGCDRQPDSCMGVLEASAEQTEIAAQNLAEQTAGQQQAQTANQQQSQAATSVTVLGNVIPISYSSSLTDAQRLAAGDNITAAANLINAKADQISAEDKTTLSKVKAITVDNDKLSGVDPKPGTTVNFRTSYLEQGGTAWNASVLFHEGYHIVQRENHLPYNRHTAHTREQEADFVQGRVGIVLGLSHDQLRALANDTHTAYNTKPY